MLQTNIVVPDDKEGSNEPTTEVRVMSCVCVSVHLLFTMLSFIEYSKALDITKS